MSRDEALEISLRIDDAVAREYMRGLAEYRLPRIAVEHSRLEGEIAQLEERLHRAVQRDTRGVLGTTLCLGDLHAGLAALDAPLAVALRTADALSAGLDAFFAQTHSVLASHERLRRAFDRLPRVAELLNAPALMRTCLRLDAFEDFLQLDAFVRRLANRSLDFCDPGAPVPALLRDLVADADTQKAALLRSLVAKLHGPLSLPDAMRYVSVLKRLDAHDPASLRSLFLSAREAYFEEAVRNVIDPSPFNRASRIMDLFRTNMFDVVSQYKALFSSDFDSPDDPKSCDPVLLTSWVSGKVLWFVDTLKDLVAKISDGGNLASLLDQCMFSALSLARIGTDIRGLLAPIFVSRVHDMFTASVSAVMVSFKAALPSLCFTRPGPKRAFAQPALNDVAPSHLTPNYHIVEFPVLAAFVNNMVNALNNLRQCPVVELQEPLTQFMQTKLEEFVSLICDQMKLTDPALLPNAESFVECVCDDVTPFITRCFDALWSSPIPLLKPYQITVPLQEFYTPPKPEVEEQKEEPQEEKEEVEEEKEVEEEVEEQATDVTESENPN